MKFHHITHGYKSLFTRISLVSIGTIFLIGINMILFGKLGWGTGIITLISGYILRSFLRLLKLTSYTFTPQGIDITAPGLWKTQTLHFPKNEIKNIEISRQARWKLFGVSVNPRTHEMQITTSGSHIYRINLKNQKTVIISPKIMEKETLSYFNT